MTAKQEKIPCQLYAISPPQIDLEKFALELEAAFAGGPIGCFQLRLKDTDDDQIIAACKRLIPICHQNNCMFLVNDRPDIAKQVGADGVHLGQEDTSCKEARKLLGKDKIIGISCYGSMDYAITAGEDSADYVAFGAFYPTQTKKPKARPEPQLLTKWVENSVLPCVAIGGIKEHNCEPLITARADFIAVVTGIWDHPDGPEKAVARFANRLSC